MFRNLPDDEVKDFIQSLASSRRNAISEESSPSAATHEPFITESTSTTGLNSISSIVNGEDTNETEEGNVGDSDQKDAQYTESNQQQENGEPGENIGDGGNRECANDATMTEANNEGVKPEDEEKQVLMKIHRHWYLCCVFRTEKITPNSECIFFSRICLCKVFQLMLLLFWVLMARFVKKLHDEVKYHQKLWFFTPTSIYILLIVYVQFFPLIKQSTRLKVFILGLMAICLGLALATFTVHHVSYVFILSSLILLLTVVFLSLLTWNGVADISSASLICSSNGLVLLLTLVLYLVPKLFRPKFSKKEIVNLWGPTLALSEVVITTFIFQIRCSISRRRLDGTQSDYLYTSLFL